MTDSAPIRAIRPRRLTAAITLDMYQRTTDPLVIALHTAAMFWDERIDGQLSLESLRNRWAGGKKLGMPAVRAARRSLIDMGMWTEVKRAAAGGRWFTELRYSELPVTDEDLAALAAELPARSIITTGGAQWAVRDDGSLLPHQPSETSWRRGSENSQPERPARTVSAVRKTHSRSDQQKSVRGLRKTHSRSDQQKRSIAPAQTGLQKTEGHASVLRTDEKNMHDAFWSKIENQLRTTVDRGGRRAVAAFISTALEAGWDDGELAEWVVARAKAARGVKSVPGFVVALLREIPAVMPASTKWRRCGECVNGWIEDPQTRVQLRRCKCLTKLATPTEEISINEPNVRPRNLRLVTDLANSFTA